MRKFNELCLQKENLIAKFYEQIKEKPSLSKSNLLKCIKSVCKEVKSTDGFPMNIIRCLRLLSTFDWHSIDEKYSYLVENLKDLYNKRKINSELYYLKQAEDFYFYMVKITGKNAHIWKEYALKQREIAENYQGNDIATKKADKGIKGFLPSLDCHDQNFTETWVAFVSNKLWLNKNKIDYSAIEMFVSMMTSKHAFFTGHVGITRSVSYNGVKNEDLACSLHSFIAQVTLKRYKHNKEYMINVPASRMREILIKRFTSKGKASDIFIGDNGSDIYLGDKLIQYDRSNLSSLLKKRDNIKLKGYDKTDHMLTDYEENELSISLLLQKKSLEEGSYIPLKIHKQPDNNTILSFVLFSKSGKKLNDLTPQEMSGEFAWFFETPWFIRNLRQPLLTANLQSMANLIIFNNSIKHIVTPEVIGNAKIL